MEVELNAESNDKKLNNLVAVTVVVLSVFTGVCNIKDGNIVQAMAQAKADAVDTWANYQATKTKLHIAETAKKEISLLGLSGTEQTKTASDQMIAALDADIVKYESEAPQLSDKAKAFEEKYDALNVHDDQFDAAEALISIAISMAAVAALVESFWLLSVAVCFGLFGMFMGTCGFAGWAFHPNVLSNFLG